MDEKLSLFYTGKSPRYDEVTAARKKQASNGYLFALVPTYLLNHLLSWVIEVITEIHKNYSLLAHFVLLKKPNLYAERAFF